MFTRLYFQMSAVTELIYFELIESIRQEYCLLITLFKSIINIINRTCVVFLISNIFIWKRTYESQKNEFLQLIWSFHLIHSVFFPHLLIVLLQRISSVLVLLYLIIFHIVLFVQTKSVFIIDFLISPPCSFLHGCNFFKWCF